MASKELSEAAVEINAILENSTPEVINKIPKKFIELMNNIASTTYQFKYDKTKTLEEQNIKLKTRAIIGLIYKDFLCNELEKQEYLKRVSTVSQEIEQEKREMCNLDDIFKKKVQEKVEQSKTNSLPIQIKQENGFIKIISFIKRLLGKK